MTLAQVLERERARARAQAQALERELARAQALERELARPQALERELARPSLRCHPPTMMKGIHPERKNRWMPIFRPRFCAESVGVGGKWRRSRSAWSFCSKGSILSQILRPMTRRSRTPQTLRTRPKLWES